MNNNLITQLSNLKLQESYIKRNLDLYYYNYKLRSKLFKDLKEVKNQINKIEFTIRLEREKKKNDIKY